MADWVLGFQVASYREKKPHPLFVVVLKRTHRSSNVETWVKRRPFYFIIFVGKIKEKVFYPICTKMNPILIFVSSASVTSILLESWTATFKNTGSVMGVAFWLVVVVLRSVLSLQDISMSTLLSFSRGAMKSDSIDIYWFSLFLFRSINWVKFFKAKVKHYNFLALQLPTIRFVDSLVALADRGTALKALAIFVLKDYF